MSKDDNKTDWKVGDWAVFDRRVVQIKDIRNGFQTLSDGVIETSGRLMDRLRPLTLQNKCIAETMEIYYNRLREIDGSAGFNYPDISSYFSYLMLTSIDGDEKEGYEKAQKFVQAARDYTPIIDGIKLFRKAF